MREKLQMKLLQSLHVMPEPDNTNQTDRHSKNVKNIPMTGKNSFQRLYCLKYYFQANKLHEEHKR